MIALLAVLSLFIGFLLGHPFLILSVFLAVSLSISIHQLLKLNDWLISERKPESIPVSEGTWGDIFNEIHILDKESRHTREELTNMVSRFQDAAAALPDAMVILTQGNEIVWSNPTSQGLLGIKEPYDMGQNITNLIRQPEFREYIEGSDYSHNITIEPAVNPDTTATLQIIPYGANQKLLIARDSTHLTRLETMRSQFIANISHELRSPITVISGYLETLKPLYAADDKDLTLAMDNMNSQTNRMEHLVTDLLALAKLETEPNRTDDQPVNVHEMLLGITEAANILSGKHKHSITLNSDAKICVLGNREHLHSLFSNIINNAVRYTPAGGNIDIKWKTDNGGAVFSVKDSGPGISPQHLPRLTERFYRVDIDRSRESGGTGLGLAIAKHVLDRHDGKLDIQSELGKGSVFTCIFPQHRII
ncbi:MAG: phosphate regulon sensor histidine kinase PhoR [Gammaproteobacteria bacterium]|nr:MAG: phosphate regulon sensor histidine kinase PhoR [Gammaproteobacteria bacterium]